MKECTQCGKCCLLYSDGGLSASAEEVEAWETFNPAIAEYVVDGKIWMDPDTGKQLTRCPWLELLPLTQPKVLINTGAAFIKTAPRTADTTLAP